MLNIFEFRENIPRIQDYQFIYNEDVDYVQGLIYNIINTVLLVLLTVLIFSKHADHPRNSTTVKVKSTTSYQDLHEMYDATLEMVCKTSKSRHVLITFLKI